VLFSFIPLFKQRSDASRFVQVDTWLHGLLSGQFCSANTSSADAMVLQLNMTYKTYEQ